MDMLEFDVVFCFSSDFVIKGLDVVEEHFSGDEGGRFIGELGAELVKNPGVADGASADHEACRSSGLEVGVASLCVDDISVGNNGAGHLLDRFVDTLHVNRGLVALFDGATVNCEEVNGVFFEDREKVGEFVR